MNLKPALFLDRDGVINKKRNDYVKDVEELQDKQLFDQRHPKISMYVEAIKK